jgi:hypothetical protein
MNLSSIQMRSGWWQTVHLRLWAADGMVAAMGNPGTSVKEVEICWFIGWLLGLDAAGKLEQWRGGDGRDHVV